LVQLPIVFALFNIIRNPLTFISRLPDETIDAIKRFIIDNKELFVKELDALGAPIYYIRNLGAMDAATNLRDIQQITIVEIFNNDALLAAVRNGVQGLTDFVNVDYGFLGQMLTNSPSAAGLSILLLIPVLNFATSFFSMKLQRKITAKTTAANMANNKSMKFMEYSMPLLIVWMAYTWEAALGLYWVFRSIVEMTQRIILSKVIPIPEITEAEYELARQQYGGTVKKKKKKKKPVEEIEESGDDEAGELPPPPADGDLGEEEEEEEGEGGEAGGGPAAFGPEGSAPILKDNEDGKYISKTIPKGINPAVKNNYNKTGKKYNIKKRKK
jgi:hypothetical protein